jgi:hypothetical protein
MDMGEAAREPQRATVNGPTVRACANIRIDACRADIALSARVATVLHAMQDRTKKPVPLKFRK